MTTNKPSRFTIFAIIFLSLVFVVLLATKPLAQDEGVFLTIAHGLFDGKIPYKDFFDHKPPGIYLFLAPFSAGHSVLWPKLAFLIVTLGIATLSYKITEKIKPGSGIFTVLLVLFSCLFFEGYSLLAEPIMTLLLLASYYLLMRQPNKANILLFVTAGLLAGLSLWFKQSALVSLMALVLALIWQKQYKALFSFLCGASVSVILLLLLLMAGKTLPQAIDQIIVVNFTSYPRESFWEVLLFLSPIFLATLPLWIAFIFNFRKKWHDLPKSLSMLALLPIPLLLFRHYPHYWLQILPFICIIAAATLASFSNKVQILLISTMVITTAFLLKNIDYNYQSLAEQKRATIYIDDLAQSDILAENQFAGFYYLTGKKSLNKYLYITEVNDWSEQAENKTLGDLETKNPVILWPIDQKYAYAQNLQQYILANFKTIQTYEHLQMAVMVRK